MNQAQYSKLFSFLWNIANDVLVHAFEKGKYKDIIMPMLVLRRIDVLLEPTKQKVLDKKALLDQFGVTQQDQVLCLESGFPFYNTSQFTLKSLLNETDPMRLKMNFKDYINGYSDDVREIIDKFHLGQQVDNLAETDRLGSLIAKFTDSNINLSIKPVLDDEGNELLPALDNHTMGTIFEELLRKFNEENNVTEAGEHFTPRDYVKLLADLAVMPIADKLEPNTTYAVYDGACGTGGILSLCQERINEVLPNAKIHLFGQELQPETFATCKADMMISGVLPQTGYALKGENRKYIAFGSTISKDGHPGETYDFCISNPPFGTPWKEDLRNLGIAEKDKKKFSDSRFYASTGGEDFSFIPDIGDCQMLFLANNVSRMKDTPMGTRIVEIHNGSSLFTGKAGGGESNLRRYIIENDMLEAIVALPEKMFYNTGIGTYVWIVTNRKAEHRRGKVQLIDATGFKTALRKNLGEKNCELSDADRTRIIDLLNNFEETPESKIFANEEFGYWEVPVLRPKRDKNGNLVYKKAKNGQEPEVEYAKNRNECERVPLTYPGGIAAFYANEVAPYDEEARFGEPVLGYELSFTKYFYKPVELRPLADIRADIRAIEERTAGMLAQILE